MSPAEYAAKRWDDYAKELATRLADNFDKGFVWKRGWSTEGAFLPYSLVRGGEYTAGNALMLELVGWLKGYSTNAWLTFNDAKALNGHVKPGEHGVPCSRPFFKDVLCYPDGKEVPEGVERTPEMKMVSVYKGTNWFTLFNYEQCEDIAPLETFASYQKRNDLHKSIPDDAYMTLTEQICQQAFVPVSWRGQKAYYSPKNDEVVLPEKARFDNGKEAFGTAAHELSHATGHPSRFSRFDPDSKEGIQSYAFEELVAELSSIFTCAKIGILHEMEESSTAYLANWASCLRKDPQILIKEVLPKANAAHKFVMTECGIEKLAKETLGVGDLKVETETKKEDLSL